MTEESRSVTFAKTAARQEAGERVPAFAKATAGKRDDNVKGGGENLQRGASAPRVGAELVSARFLLPRAFRYAKL